MRAPLFDKRKHMVSATVKEKQRSHEVSECDMMDIQKYHQKGKATVVLEEQ